MCVKEPGLETQRHSSDADAISLENHTSQYILTALLFQIWDFKHIYLQTIQIYIYVYLKNICLLFIANAYYKETICFRT